MSAEPARLRQPDDADALRAALEQMQAAQDKMARDILGLERDLKAKRARITFLENELAGRDRADPNFGTAQEIWDFWRRKCKPGARVFTEKQQQAVLARLKEKIEGTKEPAWTPRYICEAVVGAAVEPYRKGDKVFNNLELVCRDGTQLLHFHECYERHMAAKNGSNGG